MTSNREHDDSEIRIFTCFCRKGWKSCSRKMPVRCAVVGDSHIYLFLWERLEKLFERNAS